MAAITVTKSIAPRIEFLAAANGGVRIRVIDSIGNTEWETDLNASTFAALDTAMDTPGTEYLPGNANSYEGNGNMNSGGDLSPTNWLGSAA